MEAVKLGQAQRLAIACDDGCVRVGNFHREKCRWGWREA